MKCSKTINQLTGSERKRLIAEIQGANKEFLEQQCKDIRIRITCNLFKLFSLAANESCGLGAKRLISIFEEVNNLIDKSKEDEIFWQHVEARVRQILGADEYYKYFTDNPFNLEIRSNEQ